MVKTEMGNLRFAADKVITEMLEARGKDFAEASEVLKAQVGELERAQTLIEGQLGKVRELV